MGSSAKCASFMVIPTTLNVAEKVIAIEVWPRVPYSRVYLYSNKEKIPMCRQVFKMVMAVTLLHEEEIQLATSTLVGFID